MNLKKIFLEDEDCFCEFRPPHRHLKIGWTFAIAIVLVVALLLFVLRETCYGKGIGVF